MKRSFVLIVVTAILLASCNNSEKTEAEESTNMLVNENDSSQAAQLACKLTPEELQKRRETAIASLKSKVLDKKELENGYAFKFEGTDAVLDELTEFIKVERTCCDFFTFGIQVSGDTSEIWLELTGSAGTKDFIAAALEL